jgi:hypothetical protein
MLVLWCAWCGQYLGTKNGGKVNGDSHGICQHCLSELEQEISAAQTAAASSAVLMK